MPKSTEKEVAPFVWEGKTLDRYPDIIDTALRIKDKKKLSAFVEAYSARGPYALGNIGYFAGYYDTKTAKKIYAIFCTAHPIFGTSRPTVQKAFEMGKQLAKRK